MRLFLLPLLFVLALSFSACSPQSSYTRIQVIDDTYRKVADIQDQGTLAKIEKALAEGIPAQPPEGAAFYFLEAENAHEKIFWFYTPDGTAARTNKGQADNFITIKDPAAFNRLIGVK